MKQIYCHAELAILSEPVQSSSEGWAAFQSPMLIFGFFIISYLDSKKIVAASRRVSDKFLMCACEQ